MKNFRKILYGITTFIMIFSVFTTVNAQLGNYTTLVGLPGINQTTDLGGYLLGIFNLSIGIGAVLAFVMITFGGIMYSTSDALSGKSQGREYVTNAIWGLLIVIGAWVILYTINPEILTFKLVLPVANVKSGEPTVIVGSPTGTVACPTCVTIVGIPIKPGAGTTIAGALSPRLFELNNNLSQAGITNWQITEAYPPTVTHKEPCHMNGTCIDANFTTAASVDNINKFITAADASGLRAVYEVKTLAEKEALVTAGVRSTRIINADWVTAPHFSVYSQ